MAHQLGLPSDLDTAGDLVTAVIHVLQCCCDHVHVIVGVDTACYAETEKVKTSEAVFTGHRVTVSKDVSDLASTYSGLDVESSMAASGLQR